MLGLRNMLVTDKKNQVLGIITRKDLMTFNLKNKLQLAMVEGQQQEGEELSNDNLSEGSDVVLPAMTVRSSGRMGRFKYDSIMEENESQYYSDLSSPTSSSGGALSPAVTTAHPLDSTTL